MESVGFSKTQSRQLVGVMNEQAFHADYMRRDETAGDELAIALEPPRMPIGILRKSYRFPDQALAELVSEVMGASAERETSTSEYEPPDATIHHLFSRPEREWMRDPDPLGT